MFLDDIIIHGMVIRGDHMEDGLSHSFPVSIIPAAQTVVAVDVVLIRAVVVRVICLDGMMSFVVDCSFEEQIVTERHAAGRLQVKRPS